ncbi:hypothetical protein F3087_35215 [Nocardia colli]|uniref:Uncharacterized protein n=1 Tax=Nocardia colli TaxID=2545717 RepID=A0A5N0E443_9NOCA|nr:hypothetical protein [Nocardia colli]KAA8884202.1 hypothetical protein F3087_35215 [Nocardia colli]
MTLPAHRGDQLYRLVPAIYRARDEQAGFPLRDLLRVISEQVGHVEDDLDGLYDNWFIETAADWAVPYLGDLVGYQPGSAAGELAQAAPEQVRALIPRREVADSVRAHRRKGTLALLEELAADVAGWPAKAVEFYRQLAVFQHLDHIHLDRGAVADLHQVEQLLRLGGSFDTLARSVDVRRINSPLGQGLHNIPEVGVFVWRLRAYPVTGAPAACIEEVGPSCFTFSVLGNDAPLFTLPDPGTGGELGLPIPIRRHMLARRFRDYYGPGRSFSVEVGERVRGTVQRKPVPEHEFIVADLTDWAYRTPKGHVAIDPERGRLAFPPGHPPHGVWVSYHYGFSSDIGGGEYPRRLPAVESEQPAESAPKIFYQAVAKKSGPGVLDSIEDALHAWNKVRDKQPVAVIEIRDSDVYVEQLTIELRHGESLTLRAADRTRPVIYLLDKQRNAPDALTVYTEQGEKCRPGGCFTLDGILVAGRPMHVEGPLQRVQIRDCTLVPGWGLAGDCSPRRPAEPSLEIYLCSARISVQRSIIGSIQVYADEVTADPTPIEIADSVIDATDPEREAVGAPNWPLAHAAVSFTDCTVIGTVGTHAIPLAQNTLFLGCVKVARRQIGCLRYSYVPPGSRTPRRHRCQPDLVDAAVRDRPGWSGLSPSQQAELLAPERDRVRPLFTDLRYGTPGYAQLRTDCAPEIVRGADDESELGVWHDLYQPQRLANLTARLEQFTPAHTDVAVLIAN